MDSEVIVVVSYSGSLWSPAQTHLESIARVKRGEPIQGYGIRETLRGILDDPLRIEGYRFESFAMATLFWEEASSWLEKAEAGGEKFRVDIRREGNSGSK